MNGKEGCSLHKFILRSALLATCLALAGCAGGDGGGGDGGINRRPVDVDLLDPAVTSAVSGCEARLTAGNLANHAARAKCETAAARHALSELEQNYAFGDLVALLTARRTQLARQIDANTMSPGQARTQYADFHAAFLREARARERLHNANVPYQEFNICEIKGNDLSCTTQIPGDELERQVEAGKKKCRNQAKSSLLLDDEALLRCEMDALLTANELAGAIHMDLLRVQAVYVIDIVLSYRAGAITREEFSRKNKAMVSKVNNVVHQRNRRRTVGELNWRQPERCEIIAALDDLLVCYTPPASR